MSAESCYDPRTEFFTTAISSASVTGLSSIEVSSILNNGDTRQKQSIENFLEDKNCLLLAATEIIKSSGNTVTNLHIFNDITSLLGKEHGDTTSTSTASTSVIFLKPMSGLDVSDFSDFDSFKSSIMVVIIPCHSTLTILNLLRSTLHNVFIPTLSTEQHHDCTAKVSNKTISLIEELDLELASSPDFSTLIEKRLDDDFSTIQTPMDEIRFWDKLEKESRNSVVILPVKEIRQYFETNEIQTLFRMLTNYSRRRSNNDDTTNVSTNTLSSIDLNFLSNALGDGGVLEATLLNVYEVYDIDANPVYSSKRMKNTMDVITYHLCRCVINHLSPYNKIFEDSFIKIKTTLSETMEVLSSFSYMLKRLTDIDFRVTSTTKTKKNWCWTGPSYENAYATKLFCRMKKILQIRIVHYEMRTLMLLSSKKNEFEAKHSFQPFLRNNPLHMSQHADQSFNDSLLQYEKTLQSLDNILGNTIKVKIESIIQNNSNYYNPFFVLSIYSKYSNLLRRDKITSSLSSITIDLEKNIEKVINSIEDDFDNNCERALCHADIIFKCRQMQGKVNRIHTAYQTFNTISILCVRCSDILDKCKRVENKEFNKWIAQMMNAPESNHVTLEISEHNVPSSDIRNKRRMLNISFDDVLLKRLKETRFLMEILPVPLELKEKALEGDTFHRYGVMLKKVGNLYNSIENSIIPEQRPMLSDILMIFLKVFSNPNFISLETGSTSLLPMCVKLQCKNTSRCQIYIENLFEVIEKLQIENDKLLSLHKKLIQLTTSCMSIDLYSEKVFWIKKWNAIQLLFSDLNVTYTTEQISAWAYYWNYQLYKALETSYQIGLGSFSEKMGEITCELLLVDQELQFRPTLSVMRTKFYAKIKAFTDYPCNIEGIFGSKMFKAIPFHNSSLLGVIYSKLEEVFVNLESILNKYSSWLFLSAINVGAYIKKYCLKTSDFVAYLENLKSKKREASKIADFEIVERTVRISFLEFKLYVIELIHHSYDMFLMCFQENIEASYHRIDSFLSSSIESFKILPSTIEEFTYSIQLSKRIKSDLKNMRILSGECKTDLKLLRSYSSTSSLLDQTKLSKKKENLENSLGKLNVLEREMKVYDEHVEMKKVMVAEILDNRKLELKTKVDSVVDSWISRKKEEQIAKEPENNVNGVIKILQELMETVCILKQESSSLNINCKHFNVDSHVHEEKISEIDEEIKTSINSWSLFNQFKTEIEHMKSTLWIHFRNNFITLNEFSSKWSGILEDHSFITTPFLYMRRGIGSITNVMPVLKYCRGEDFMDDHWIEFLQGQLNLPKEIKFANLTFGHLFASVDTLLDDDVHNNLKDLQSRAKGEVMIRADLHEITSWSQQAKLSYLNYEFKNLQISLVKSGTEILTDIEKKQSLLSSIKDSPFFQPFRNIGKVYESQFSNLFSIIDLFNKVQKKWIYLYPILSCNSISVAHKWFNQSDSDFRHLLGQIETSPLLFDLVNESINPNLVYKLESIIQNFQHAQRAMYDYLEDKRALMPRFYFLGDDDLLDLLGQPKNPKVVQAHFKSLFQGISTVTYDSEAKYILTIQSSAKESVELVNPVEITSNPEVWLGDLSLVQKKSLSSSLGNCLNSTSVIYESYSSQVLYLADRIEFTNNVETSLKNTSSLFTINDRIYESIQSLIMVNKPVDHVHRLKLKYLLLEKIHQRDIIDYLIKSNVSDLSSWHWLKQMRYYQKEDGLIVKMCDAKCDYSFEYQGNQSKLINTPLSDKCYLVLMQGLHFGLSGNIYGEAGTGKTETVKSLGSLLGRQVIVFNCDESVDYTSISRMFIGIVSSGSFGSFDEFNRLQFDKLSALSQTIQLIQDALINKTKSIELLNKPVAVNKNAGIFITLNPVGKCYKGRSKLPQNISALFRPFAMGHPDIELISELYLFADGFLTSKVLSQNIISVFKVSHIVLSSQIHYDWSLRSIKAVLGSAGKLLQDKKSIEYDVTEKEEAEIVVSAIKSNIISRLTPTDLRSFLDLISDVFIKANSTTEKEDDMKAIIRRIMVERPLSLEIDEHLISKTIQLKNVLNQRTGCVIVGPITTGKSTIWKLLKETLNLISDKKIVTHLLSPKSMPRDHFIGYIAKNTREWIDGLLIKTCRKVVSESTNSCWNWIIIDGEIDPDWIEFLNSSLDDNKLLTLPSGERLSFGNDVNFIFETTSLKFVSPATISRMGIIHLNSEYFDVSNIVKKWLKYEISEKERENLSCWINKYFFQTLKLALEIDMVIEVSKVGLVQTTLSHLNSCENEHHFLICLFNGLSSNMTASAREKFVAEINKNWSRFDLMKDIDLSKSKCSAIKPIHGNDFVNIKSTKRIFSLIEIWLEQNNPFILIGGHGKESMLRYFFAAYRIKITFLYCNAITTPKDVILKIKQTCVSLSSQGQLIYQPSNTKKLILILKNVNLPNCDKYGHCMLMSFLRQLITMKGYYDEDDGKFILLERVQIVLTADIPHAKQLCPKLTSILKVAYVDEPDKDDLSLIYDGLLKTIKHSELERSKLIAQLMDMYEEIIATFNNNIECSWSFRNIISMIQGLNRYDLEKDDITSCLMNEAVRVFKDSLKDEASRQKFDVILRKAFQNLFFFEKDLCFSLLSENFTRLSKPTKSKEDSLNSPLVMRSQTVDSLKMIAGTYIKAYEKTVRKIDIFLFREMLSNIIAIEHTLSKDNGHLILIGTGVGKKTTTRLVCFFHQIAYFTPDVTVEYGLQSFSLCLKRAMKSAGIDNEKICFFVEEHQMEGTEILGMINSAISGEILGIPGLFSRDDIDYITENSKHQYTDGDHYDSPIDLFLSRVRTNLHICLSMGPKSTHLFESYPSLCNRCDMKWMREWNTSTMREFCKLHETIQIDSGIKQPVFTFDTLIDIAINIHDSTKQMDTSSIDFVKLLNSWKILYYKHEKNINLELNRVLGGLDKLNEARSMVDELKIEAKKKQNALTLAQIETDNTMESISNALMHASMTKATAKLKETEIAKQVEETAERKSLIENEILKIKPLLDQAKKAVNGIKKDNLNELRSLKSPPQPISDVLSGVLMLLGIKDLSWVSMKRFLSNQKIKEDILNFDARKVSQKIKVQVQNLLITKSKSFDGEKIIKVSVAAAPLAAWVKANYEYALVLDKIKPLKNELDEAETEIGYADRKLIECKEKLKQNDDEVIELKKDFSLKMKEAEDLKNTLKNVELRLDNAQSLVRELVCEAERWEILVLALNRKLRLLGARMLLCSSFSIYLVKTNEITRTKYLEIWLLLFGNNNELNDFSMSTDIGLEIEQRIWRKWQLPNESLCLENASAMHTIRDKVPYIIDPDEISSKWLSSFLGDKGTQLEYVCKTDLIYADRIGLCVKYGKTLIITDADGVDPFLYPIVKNDFICKDSHISIVLGGNRIEVAKGFYMLITTRTTNAYPLSSVKGYVTELNFTVNERGLEKQLLNILLDSMEPELRILLNRINEEEEKYQAELFELESNLLEKLRTADGDILQNSSLVSTLSRTKEKAVEISLALDKGRETSKRLLKHQRRYQSSARYGSKLFSLISTLHIINPLYKFGLDAFIGLYSLVLRKKNDLYGEKDKGSRKFEKEILCRTIIYVLRSVFKKDRPAIALYIVARSGMTCAEWGGKRWDIFLGVIKPVNSHIMPTWLPPEKKEALATLVEYCPDLMQKIDLESNDWIKWFKCYEVDFPVAKLSAVERLLLIKGFRQDRLFAAIVKYCCEHLGLDTLTPLTLKFDNFWEEIKDSKSPIMLLTQGSNPSKELESFMAKQIGHLRYKTINMGHDEHETAINMLQNAAKLGEWVCLYNIHLVSEWLPTLWKIISKITHVHADFRVWFTCEPHDGILNFGSKILEMSQKLVFENPPGIKESLKLSYTLMHNKSIEKSFKPRSKYSQLLFILSWFHAVVQERSFYNPQGWTDHYHFNNRDFEVCLGLLDKCCGVDGINWLYLHDMLLNFVYGAKIDNPFDLKVLEVYVKKYFNEKVLHGKLDIAKGVRVPLSEDPSKYIKEIMALPDDIDSPCAFGLPANCDLGRQRALGERALDTLNTLEESIMTMALKKTESDFLILDQWMHHIHGKEIILLEEKDYKPLKNKLGVAKNIRLFLISETSLSRKLCSMVESDFTLLKDMINTNKNERTRRLANDVINGIVPVSWKMLWHGPKNLTSWLYEVVDKSLKLNELHRPMCGSSNDNSVHVLSLEKTQVFSIDLSYLFNPMAFFYVLKCKAATKMGCPLNKMKIYCSFDESNNQGSYSSVEGLKIQGAAFAKNILSKVTKLDSELLVIPSLNIAIRSSDDDPSKSDANSCYYTAPLFFDLSRQKLIAEFNLPCLPDDKNKWILASVALFMKE